MDTNVKAFLDAAIKTALEKARKDIELKIKQKAAIDLSLAFTGLISSGIVEFKDVKEIMESYGLTLTFVKEKSSESTDKPSRPVETRSNRSFC